MRGEGSVRKRKCGGWQVRYSVGGKPVAISVAQALGKPAAAVTEREAHDFLRDRLAEVRLGHHVSPEEQRLTVAKLIDELLAHERAQKAKSLPSMETHTKPIVAMLGHVRALDLTPARVERYIVEMERAPVARGDKPYATGSVAYQCKLLRMAFNLARKRGRIGRVPYIPCPSVDNVRQGFVEVEDFEAIVATMPAPYADVARMLYLSGWRYREITGLTWADVDGRAGVIRLAKSKNGDGRALPVDVEIEAILAQRQRLRVHRNAIVPWVFHKHGRRVGQQLLVHWKQACLAAGLPALLIHDLRRSAVKNLIAAGVPEPLAMKQTGHRSRDVFRRYAIFSTADVKAGMAVTATYRAARLATTRTERGQSQAVTSIVARG